MTYNAAQAFDREAESYDAARRRLIPPFDAFYGTAVQALGLIGRVPERVLDLGAGTGILAGRIREAYPQAHITLLDGAAAMLDQARQKLGTELTDYVVGGLTDPLPAGGFDAVVSALAIHHLPDEGKQLLNGRVHQALTRGGVFVNAEQVAGPTPLLSRVYEDWHERRAREAGSSDREWAAALGRMEHDRLTDVETQLAWLREAGFDDADCLFKDHRFAVIVALRA